MINGRFVVYGSPGHLKAEYGTGYAISVKFMEEKRDEVNKLVAEQLSYLEFKDTVMAPEQIDGKPV